MKKLLLFLSLISLSILLPAQSQEIDSLKKVINDKTIKDKSNPLNLLYLRLKNQDINQAKSYLDQAYNEALRNKNKKELGFALNSYGNYYKRNSELDTALIIFKRALKVRMEAEDTLGVSKVYNNLGSLYLEMSKYRKAIESIQKALEYKFLLHDTVGAGISYNVIGSIYNKWEKNEIAIENYQNALKLFQAVHHLVGIASCYNNLGLIYQNLAKETDTIFLNKALEFFMKALEINESIDDKRELASVQSNIANMYASKGDKYKNLLLNDENKGELDSLTKINYQKNLIRYFDSAIRFNENSAKNREEIGDFKGLAGSYIGMGAVYNNQKESQKALPYFFKALDISLQNDDKYQTAVTYTYIGMSYINLKDYSKALIYLGKAEDIAIENGIKREEQTIYKSFAETYDSLRDYKTALNFFRKFSTLRDETYSKEYLQNITDMQTKYETDQKEAELELANQENEKQQLKSERQMLIIYGFIGVFLIIIVFSFIVFKQFKQIQKSNKILSEQKIAIEVANEELNQQNEEISAQRDEIQGQKDHIEEIHKEVSDSIHYAERIQKAILPKVNDLEGKISDRFTLFKPKDIVSGDFYWMKHIKKSNLLIATAADCTGHGVPGAFMSMLGIAFLNEIVSKASVTTSGQVLDSLRQSVITSLHQTGKEGEAQDGMDISLIAFNYETKILQFSGANNPLYIVRSNVGSKIEIADKAFEGETHTLYEIKGDKMPIGIYKKELVDFTTIEIQLQENDQIYMFSDGYADQFGGPTGKKLKYQAFKQLILDNIEKPMAEQSAILNDYFEKWRGQLEQIDDVIVMGIKI